MTQPWNIVHVLDAVLAPESGLSSTERLVVLAVARYRDAKTGECYPSCDSIARDTGLDERTVRRVLDGLRGRGGAAVRVQWAQPSRRTSRRYTIELQHLRQRTPRPDRTPALSAGTTPGLSADPLPALGSADDFRDRIDDPVTPDPVAGLRPDPMPADPPIVSTHISTQGDAGFALAPPEPPQPKKMAARMRKTGPRRRKQEQPLPANWKPNGKHAAYAARKGLDLETETDKFTAHAAANDRRQVDWNGAFSQWLASSYGYAKERGVRAQGAQNPSGELARIQRNAQRVQGTPS